MPICGYSDNALDFFSNLEMALPQLPHMPHMPLYTRQTYSTRLPGMSPYTIYERQYYGPKPVVSLASVMHANPKLAMVGKVGGMLLKAISQ